MTFKITKKIVEDIKSLLYSRIGLTAFMNERNALDIKITEGRRHIKELEQKLDVAFDTYFIEIYIRLEDGDIIRVNRLPYTNKHIEIESMQITEARNAVKE